MGKYLKRREKGRLGRAGQGWKRWSRGGRSQCTLPLASRRAQSQKALGGLGPVRPLTPPSSTQVGHEWPVLTVLTVFGSWISYIYSAPPLKLKQNGWAGNYALGASYIALPWWAGQALFGELSLDVMVMTVLYSIAGLGIAIVNDFKSIEGDRAMGLNSLPVRTPHRITPNVAS